MSSIDSLDLNMSMDVFSNSLHLCKQSKIGCASYHYLRPILRRIGAIASPYTHSGFYREALKEAIAETKEPHIAISGTADYAWLLEDSPLVTAVGSKACCSSIVVSDACLTPLEYSLKVARRIGIDTWLLQADIRNSFSIKEQDAIVTDAFLTQFAESDDRLAILS